MSPAQTVTNEPWNHNIYYHPLVLSVAPANCARALDVGCGQGILSRKLATKCREVIAIDADHDTIAHVNSGAEVAFIEGDVMTYPFAPNSFDLITAVATLHHLPLKAALARFKSLLRPGATLVVIGLYQLGSPLDYAIAAASIPVSWTFRRGRPRHPISAPLAEPTATFRTIRAACNEILPGTILRRRLFFRYSLIWRKP